MNRAGAGFVTRTSRFSGHRSHHGPLCRAREHVGSYSGAKRLDYRPVMDRLTPEYARTAQFCGGSEPTTHIAKNCDPPP
jgi:hypothetical protein